MYKWGFSGSPIFVVDYLARSAIKSQGGSDICRNSANLSREDQKAVLNPQKVRGKAKKESRSHKKFQRC